jgi:C4-dicarboxylate transporter DctM subunit
VTTGGSVGLLLPYSLPLLIFALVAHVDFVKAFKAVVLPGVMVIVMLALYAAWVGHKEKVPRAAEARARWRGRCGSSSGSSSSR